jgi:opacity protein-like surface antigen
MMRMRFSSLLVVVGSIALLAQPAAAQPRVPDTGMSAFEGSFGALFPEDPLDTDLTLQGAYQYFFAPRTGLRTTLGWADPNFKGSGNSLRQVRVTLDLLYNWEGGRWHPFVGAGAGAYFIQHRVGGQAVGPSGTRPGLNVNGGVEYFMTRRVTLKGEAAYHIVSQGNLPWSPSGLALMVGLKRYL